MSSQHLPQKIAVSIGDYNGISPQILLESHDLISQFCDPIYFTDASLLERSGALMNIPIPTGINYFPVLSPSDFQIRPGQICPVVGRYSFDCFEIAIRETTNQNFAGIVTLPIQKQSWNAGGIFYKGHTDFLSDFFQKDAIMMIGCEDFYVALFTVHIPLKEVPPKIQEDPIKKFLLNFDRNTCAEKYFVPGLNPHAGENGLLGDEDEIVKKAIAGANQILGIQKFIGPLSPDIAFLPELRKESRFFVALYHDQGLIPVKTLFFEESINVSLNLPILRTSVGHGTGFNKAYKSLPLNLKSYVNAVKYICLHR